MRSAFRFGTGEGEAFAANLCCSAFAPSSCWSAFASPAVNWPQGRHTCMHKVKVKGESKAEALVVRSVKTFVLLCGILRGWGGSYCMGACWTALKTAGAFSRCCLEAPLKSGTNCECANERDGFGSDMIPCERACMLRISAAQRRTSIPRERVLRGRNTGIRRSAWYGIGT